MNRGLEQRDGWLWAAVLALLLLAVWGPTVLQPAHHHDFADARSWGHLPCAMDVLSNAPFALWGVVGLVALAALHSASMAKGEREVAQRGLAAVFLGGLVLTAGASSWYHLRPDDAGLLVDRLGMVVAFAGLLGLAAADRVSARAGWLLGAAVMVLGPVSVAVWATSGNVGPWLVLQLGGMALLLGLAWVPPQAGAWAIRWGWVIAVYGLAKLLELGDHAIYEWTSQLVSGHSLKHIVASLAAWPVIVALHNQGRIGRLQRGLPAQTIDKNRSHA